MKQRKSLKVLLFILLGFLVLWGISRQNLPVDISESVLIDAEPKEIWSLATDFEGAFENSNPAHRGTKILSRPKRPFRDSLRFYQKEEVGGITAHLDGVVYDVYPNKSFRWKASTIYHFLNIEIPVQQGGTFRIEYKQKPRDIGYLIESMDILTIQSLVEQLVG